MITLVSKGAAPGSLDIPERDFRFLPISPYEDKGDIYNVRIADIIKNGHITMFVDIFSEFNVVDGYKAEFNTEHSGMQPILNFIARYDKTKEYEQQQLDKRLEHFESAIRVELILESWEHDFCMKYYKPNNPLPLMELFVIMRNSNYLGFGHLTEVTTQFVSNLLKDKTPEQMAKILGVENDLTPQEKREIEEHQRMVRNTAEKIRNEI